MDLSNTKINNPLIALSKGDGRNSGKKHQN